MAESLTIALFRKLALSLPNTVESAHMKQPDFRVVCGDGRLRIFATLSGQERGLGVLKLTLDQQAAFCEEVPSVFEPVQGGWGRMGMTYVRIAAAPEDTLLGALATAHHNVVSSADVLKSKRTSKHAQAKPAAAPAKPKMKM